MDITESVHVLSFLMFTVSCGTNVSPEDILHALWSSDREATAVNAGMRLGYASS